MRLALLRSGILGCPQRADHSDLLPVHNDGGGALEPVLRKPSSKPIGGIAGVRLLGLLPAAGAPVPAPVHVMMCFHDYMIT